MPSNNSENLNSQTHSVQGATNLCVSMDNSKTVKDKEFIKLWQN